MFIYKIINKINNQCYIGQTTRSLEDRWKWHCKDKSCTYLYRAIKKYDKENFYIEILEICLDKDSLNLWERFWIKELNTLVPNGYNISHGGTDGTFLGRYHSEESKKKISKRLTEIGHKPIITPEIRLKITSKIRGKKYGPRTEEVKRKISLKNSGINHGMYKNGHLKKTCTPIFCITTNKVFISQSEAARQLNLHQPDIYKVLIGKCKQTGGYQFRYIEAKNG